MQEPTSPDHVEDCGSEVRDSDEGGSKQGGDGNSSDSGDSIELVRFLPRRRLDPESADGEADGFTEPALTFPCGCSFAATRIKGRGFIAPPPLRPERGVQTEEACPFQAFLRGDSHAAHQDHACSFWLDIARELYGACQRITVPVDSIGSWEAMSRLDHEHGIPAEEFLGLFTVCPACRTVRTRYWAEDHGSVCPARGD
ncbi:hypothetical protein EST38_g11011 [Candolleomyces aberdarensis]|uniref:Uncharacterized protein n=1 Tax=Candolleomyces aberdarensis TaxID=2316362 RepID=A0A4Q2D8Q7_9AGAR|nr:hypothetical protein EST38_g11011 [Candolleomyces aberdarensis]